MHKAINTKCFYLAVETFPEKRKDISGVYKSGFRYWRTIDINTYSIVIYRFRVMFGIKNNYGEGAG